MTRFAVTATPLEGLREVTRTVVGDARGFLSRLFCADELREAGFDRPVAQCNHTLTAIKGTVRGMHFQHAPHAEDKLVFCIRGEVWDVAVDVRAGSTTRLQWHAARLSPENRRGLLIPRGFAHGFQALSDDCELIYFHSHPYAAAAEAGVNPRDPALAIDWPLPIAALSDRDANHPHVDHDFTGVSV
jgi:dTDP-4-dehydrorhamnose 3,5-epimerase